MACLFRMKRLIEQPALYNGREAAALSEMDFIAEYSALLFRLLFKDKAGTFMLRWYALSSFLSHRVGNNHCIL